MKFKIKSTMFATCSVPFWDELCNKLRVITENSELIRSPVKFFFFSGDYQRTPCFLALFTLLSHSYTPESISKACRTDRSDIKRSVIAENSGEKRRHFLSCASVPPKSTWSNCICEWNWHQVVIYYSIILCCLLYLAYCVDTNLKFTIPWSCVVYSI